MRGLLEQLCILESIDELKLLTLHTSNVCLILSLLISFTSQLLFELLTSSILPLHELHLSLLCGLLLLLLDHSFHVAGTLLLVRALLLVHLPRRLLLHFSVEGGLFLPLHRAHLTILDSLVRNLFVLTIHLAFHSFVHLLLAEALLLGLLILDVPLPLADDLICALSRLIDLLHDLYDQAVHHG